MAVSLDSSVLDQLNTDEARGFHELVNQLSSCGVGRIVNLPQIIVVGEQSSGKSSVLEAITHVRFPVKDNLCTRFATEFVLRQAPQTRVDISIRFHDTSKPPQMFRRSNFTEHDLAEIIDEAKEHMGITATGKHFSKDVLRLEIEGPSMYPLTLVDLPGLYHVETEDQSESGLKTVEELVGSYMKQKNSINLLVITATNQLANHIALRKVKEIDPKRDRTLGVITKPDLTRPGYADERTYIKVAMNRESAHNLKLGWHVLRNRAEDEESLAERDEKEDVFFQETAWRSIPPQDRGIASLRRKLSRVMYDHIRKNINGVTEDISSHIKYRREELNRLGNPRSELEDMRSYLLSISSEFQRIARDGIQGRYDDPFFGGLEDTDHKLRAHVRNFNRIFHHMIQTKGSKLAIKHDDAPKQPHRPLPNYLEKIAEAYSDEFPDSEMVTMEDLSAQLQEQAASNQGRELPGMPNHNLVIQLFRTQASPWERIAQYHISTVLSVAKSFVDELFRRVIVGFQDADATTEAILRDHVDVFFAEKENFLREKLQEILEPYKQGFSMPLDEEFQRAMEARSRQRMAKALNGLLEQNPRALQEKNGGDIPIHSAIDAAISHGSGPGNADFGTIQVINMMQVYYEASLRTFTDNVINLAIESCLIRDIPDIMTPTKVDKMSKEELMNLAAESEDTTARRAQLNEDMSVLLKGLEKCQKLRPRPITVVPMATKPSTAASKSDVSPDSKSLSLKKEPKAPKNGTDKQSWTNQSNSGMDGSATEKQVSSTTSPDLTSLASSFAQLTTHAAKTEPPSTPTTLGQPGSSGKSGTQHSTWDNPFLSKPGLQTIQFSGNGLFGMDKTPQTAPGNTGSLFGGGQSVKSDSTTTQPDTIFRVKGARVSKFEKFSPEELRLARYQGKETVY